GHCYFSLKDEKASVKAVMFRADASRLAFTPENGMRVIARCRVSLYERDGSFQLYVEDLFPDGVGATQLAFEQLKQRLLKEGLFEGEHKKSIPAYPKCVGVVTSKTGAALQDILKVAAHRCPAAHFLLAPVTVQGQAAAPEIANAITLLDNSGMVDVIIVARGGGSAEDLWVFNAEEIARAAFAAKTPVVSAIGHEIDVTILDFVADLRAPTPSAAAEMVLPDLWHTAAGMMNIYTSITKNIQFRLNSCYNDMAQLTAHGALLQLQQLPSQKRQLLAEYSRAITGQMAQKANKNQLRMQTAAKLAAGLNPYAVLGRGYAVVYNPKGDTINTVKKLAPGKGATVQLKDGSFTCTVQAIEVNQEK
ncbi:exodeoxyribonuclease VII large subunit, partial [Ruminococcaceae bacterium OttesenSCG-928-A16]|nr:exodeoxyribonuclease VII large subunit [Ruminococcaceae bacterium OttesenSCG-928-A16]